VIGELKIIINLTEMCGQFIGTWTQRRTIRVRFVGIVYLTHIGSGASIHPNLESKSAGINFPQFLTQVLPPFWASSPLGKKFC